MAEALGVAVGEAVWLKKEAYGLIAAPLCWYKRVCQAMADLGFQRPLSYPCCWVLECEGSEEDFFEKLGITDEEMAQAAAEVEDKR